MIVKDAIRQKRDGKQNEAEECFQESTSREYFKEWAPLWYIADVEPLMRPTEMSKSNTKLENELF